MVRGFEGGYTAIFFTGVARNVWHCDVASLYPSIMLQFDCFPVTDQLQIFRHLLTDLRTFRLEAKASMRDAKDAAAAALLPRPAKHLQDSDQQLLWLSRFRSGTLCRFRRRRARHPDRPRSAQKMIDWLKARRAGHRSRYRRHLLRPARRDSIVGRWPPHIGRPAADRLPLQRVDDCAKVWPKNCRPGSRSSSTSNSTPCSATRRRTTRSSPATAKSLSKAARSNRADWRNSSGSSSRK